LDEPQKFMDYLASVYQLKQGSVKEPDIYLGANVKKFADGVDNRAWGISSDTYIRAAVVEVERKLAKVAQKLAIHQ
jgi:hypothetical protein